MFILTLGITVLLVRLIPAGSLIYYYIFQQSSLAAIPKEWAFSFVMLLNYIVAFILTLIFINSSNLRSRLPARIPGKEMIITGIILLIVFLLPQMYFLERIPGIRQILMQTLPLRMVLGFFAHLFVTIGVVQALLEVSPRRVRPLQTTQQIDLTMTGSVQELDPEWMEKLYGNK